MQMAEKRPIVWVRRQYNNWKRAAYYLDQAAGWHVDCVSGGVRATANRSYNFAYVWCDAMIEGELDHSCRHGKGPHLIKVCVTKAGNEEAWPDIQRAIEDERVKREVRQRKMGV